MSMSFIVWSLDVDIRNLPSPEKLADVTESTCASTDFMNVLLFGVQNLTVPSLCPVAKTEPYGTASTE